jgi:P27 family predicted phage terminase small subunit
LGARGRKSDKHLNVIGPAEKRPKPRYGMTQRARNLWTEIVNNLPPTHFRKGDYPLLRAYCEAEELHYKATKAINKEGAVIQGKVVKQNPWVAIQTQTAHTMSQLATKLRLCPNSRITRDQSGAEKEKRSKRNGLMFGGHAE